MSVLAEPALLLGSTTPRLFTPPLRPLTPATSYGFEVTAFAEEIGRPLLPWQREAVIRGGELLCGPDCSEALGVHGAGCRPRFRIVLLVVSRQNGKTELPVILSVFWQFRQKIDLIVGTSTKLDYAKESWLKAINLVRSARVLDGLHEPGRKWFRLTNGETESWTVDGCRYKIAAANGEGGRSLSIRRGIADELRQHKTYEAWDAFEPACSHTDSQIWALSNAGSGQSVVLNDLQDAARQFIQTGIGDTRLGLLEWSAPEDADPEDVGALLQANPRVGYGLDLDTLLGAAARAKRTGGAALNGFKTERMCIRVAVDDPAIPREPWRACRRPGEIPADLQRRVAATIDVTPDGDHVTLAVAAVLPDGLVRVETVGEWSGRRATSDAERDLPGILGVIRPRVLGWMPDGPGAVLASKLTKRQRGKQAGIPLGTRVQEIRGEVAAICLGLHKEVLAGTLVHSGQAMLDAQVEAVEKAIRGDVWVFTRKGGPADAVYAVAGAVYLARTVPADLGGVRVILPSQ